MYSKEETCGGSRVYRDLKDERERRLGGGERHAYPSYQVRVNPFLLLSCYFSHFLVLPLEPYSSGDDSKASLIVLSFVFSSVVANHTTAGPRDGLRHSLLYT